MSPRPAPIVGEKVTLMPTHVRHVVVKVACWSHNRLESVSIVREEAESLPTGVTSVWGLVGLER